MYYENKMCNFGTVFQHVIHNYIPARLKSLNEFPAVPGNMGTARPDLLIRPIIRIYQDFLLVLVVTPGPWNWMLSIYHSIFNHISFTSPYPLLTSASKPKVPHITCCLTLGHAPRLTIQSNIFEGFFCTIFSSYLYLYIT